MYHLAIMAHTLRHCISDRKSESRKRDCNINMWSSSISYNLKGSQKGPPSGPFVDKMTCSKFSMNSLHPKLLHWHRECSPYWKSAVAFWKLKNNLKEQSSLPAKLFKVKNETYFESWIMLWFFGPFDWHCSLLSEQKQETAQFIKLTQKLVQIK